MNEIDERKQDLLISKVPVDLFIEYRFFSEKFQQILINLSIAFLQIKRKI